MEEKKIRTSIVIYPWVKKAIRRITIESDQQMSDFINDVLIEKLAEMGYTPPQSYKNLSELVKKHQDWLLDRTQLTEECLQDIIDGHVADEITQLRLALSLEMSESEIKILNSKQPHQNGEREKCHH